MIIFIDDDRAYRNWINHHRSGFVLDGRRRPRVRQLVLHRASCGELRSGGSRRKTHDTTAGRLKACADRAEELQRWTHDEIAAAASDCSVCRPGVVEPHENHAARLTKLAADILDYVVDAAVIHLENEHPPYRLSVGDVAACFAKTPRQLGAALQQLVESGRITARGKAASRALLAPRTMIFPTPAALRTLEAFRGQSDAELLAELQRLGPVA